MKPPVVPDSFSKGQNQELWQKGPLPPGTYNWGGVTTKNTGKFTFLLADFCGDHVKVIPTGERIEAKDIVLYNNSLELPGQP